MKKDHPGIDVDKLYIKLDEYYTTAFAEITFRSQYAIAPEEFRDFVLKNEKYYIDGLKHCLADKLLCTIFNTIGLDFDDVCKLEVIRDIPIEEVYKFALNYKYGANHE